MVSRCEIRTPMVIRDGLVGFLKLPIPYDNCAGVPISHLHTVFRRLFSIVSSSTFNQEKALLCDCENQWIVCSFSHCSLMCPHLSMYYGWSVSGVCSEQPPEHGKHLPWTNRSTFSRSELTSKMPWRFVPFIFVSISLQYNCNELNFHMLQSQSWVSNLTVYNFDWLIFERAISIFWFLWEQKICIHFKQSQSFI